MVLICDSREQRPLVFKNCHTIRGAISTFDYALEGDQNSFAVERKSLPDLIGSLALQCNYTRELKKIRRAREIHHMPRIFYVVEANREDIERFDYSRFKSGKITPQFIFKRLSELQYTEDVHVIFSGNPHGAARDVQRILKRRAEDLMEQEGDL